ncbi:MAG: hypothetical protein LUQ32_01000 [Methanomicrobiales archaeon]|nr:hypothetical protein [Methanomicrobiales archaeon]
MERYRFLAFFLPIMAAAAQAQTPFSLQTESAQIMGFIYDYYLPVFGGILLLFLIFLGVNRALRRRFGPIEFGLTVFGVLLSLVLIATGLVFLAAVSVLAWGTAIGDISYGGADGWAIPLANEIQYRIQPILDMIFGSVDYTIYLQNILLGVLLIGGGIITILGILLLWKLPKSSFYAIIKPGDGTTTFKEVIVRGQEPLAPTVTFKVIDRLTNQPSPDVKVILKHKEGAKVYNRYTDFNGEVIFQKIDGLFSQYYAYVEGDEERKRYWVIRTAIGAESVT